MHSSTLMAAHTGRFRALIPWKDYVNSTFPWLEFHPTGTRAFHGEVEAYRLAAGSLATIRTSSLVAERTQNGANRSDAGYLKVVWRLSGSAELEQGNNRSDLSCGAAAVCDTARPYRVCVSDDALLAVLTLPYHCCPGWERISEHVCGTQLPPAASNASLAALLALFESGDSLEGDAGDVISAVQWLLSGAFHRMTYHNAPSGRQADRIAQAWRHIREHSDDPALNPEQLARALHMSRRALYLMFQEHGLTPASLILDVRLERCREALRDVAQMHRSITEIVFEHGFNDSSSFGRLFKARYGVSPSEWRALAQEVPQGHAPTSAPHAPLRATATHAARESAGPG